MLGRTAAVRRHAASSCPGTSTMYRGPYGIVGIILVVILVIILLRLLGLF